MSLPGFPHTPAGPQGSEHLTVPCGQFGLPTLDGASRITAMVQGSMQLSSGEAQSPPGPPKAHSTRSLLVAYDSTWQTGMA